MLHLASSTAAGWDAWALAHLDEILLDHAHCEKKAASTAMSLIFRYPERPALAVPLARPSTTGPTQVCRYQPPSGWGCSPSFAMIESAVTPASIPLGPTRPKSTPPPASE